MKILSMNIRGFGGASKQKALSLLFHVLNPDMILIQETMCNFSQALFLFSKLKPRWVFYALDSSGLFGGLLSCWNPLLVWCKAYSSFVGILLKVGIKGISNVFSIINCYDPYSHHIDFWNNVLTSGLFYFPDILLAGDLKFTLSISEV